MFSIAANILGLRLLSSGQYATASIAIASTAIVLPICFQPFAKYVLVSGEWKRVGRIFWLLQPFVAVLVLGAALAVSTSDASTSIVLSAAVLSISQGWKEFCGELARSMGEIQRMQRLYVFDAASTAVLTGASLSLWPSAEMLLLSSATSSIFWAIRYTPFKSFQSVEQFRMSDLAPIFKYSSGISIATFFNSSMLVVGRSAIRQASPPDLAGAIQFLLDILQKSAALIASSLMSAVVPEARRVPLNQMMRPLIALLVATLLVLTTISIGMTLTPAIHKPLSMIAMPVAVTSALYVWANRYKGVALDMPLISSEAHSMLVVPGAILSFLAILFASDLQLGLISFMVLAALLIFLTGLASTISANRIGLISFRVSFVVIAVPAVITAVIAAAVWSLSVEVL